MPSLHAPEQSPGYIRQALIASLILHCFVVVGFWKAQISKTAPLPEISFSAELIPAPPVIKQNVKEKLSQIVSPPQKSEDPPTEQKQIFQSDEDNVSIKQQIRRGEEGVAKVQTDNQKESSPSPAVKKEAVEKTASKTPEKPAQTAKTNSSDIKLKLKLDSASLAELSAQSNEKNKQTKTSNEKLQEALQANANANQRSSISLKRSGSQDYLPDIPDGEVTLLNTKANKYAVFVRRVASQVFANLRGAGWRSLSAADIRAINKDGIFEAVLSPKGDLLSLNLSSSSESGRFDQVLQLAIKNGAKDPNPPKGAEAEDGNIHFIFQARSWVQFQPNPRTGVPNERRWLVLGTGLE